MAKCKAKKTTVQNKGFKAREPKENYNDYYKAKYHSEREFNLAINNDQRMYDHFQKNKKRLKKEVSKHPYKVANELKQNSSWAKKSFTPSHMRKTYIRKVIKGE